jgi:hypothetical protein
MPKPKKKSKKRPSSQKTTLPSTPKTSILEKLEQPRYIVGYFVVLFIFLLFFYKPIVFEGLEGSGGDVTSNIGNSHQLYQFREETGKRPLWNPYMFAGTPIYHRLGGVVWSVDTMISKLDSVIDWRVWYLWLGAVGMFLLAKYLGLSAISGMMAGVCFILIPHFHALNIVGHFSKLRALMWIPFVLLTFLLLLKRRNLLSTLFFTFTFTLLMRTQHYQIIFYAVLLLFVMGIVPYARMALEKRWNHFLRFNGLFIGSVLLVLISVAQPLLVTRDYTPYSTRGGNAVSLQEPVSEKDKKGVGFDYATSWSYSIPEFWNLVVPKFHGGTSQEVYTGNTVPRLRNQVIPAYWGDMPFTQSYEYMGVILLFLALTGVFFRWRRPEVKYLVILTLIALLLSLGKNFSVLYKLFFYYFPYFDKFRAPMMILTLVAFNVSILAAFGLDFILGREFERKEVQKRFYKIAGAFLIILLIPFVLGSSFSLSPAQELQRYTAQYGANQATQIVNMFKEARLDILKSSSLRTLLLFLAGGGLLIAIARQWMTRDVLVLSLGLLAACDLGFVSADYMEGKFIDAKQNEAQTYRENEVDRLIKQDKSLYRVLPPLRAVANDSRWPYRHQSIGGYSPAKLQVIQDIISNNLPQGSGSLPFNLKVVSMLNGKYLGANETYDDARLEYVGASPQDNLHLFRNKDVLPRAYFVGSVRVIEDGIERLRFMNSPEFEPGTTALLEETFSESIQLPDSSYARVSHFEPDEVLLEAYTDKKSLMVLSEIYYPKGWRAFMENGDELRIYKTNHLLRSVVVPAGEHTITFEFKPNTYYAGIRVSFVGFLIVYGGLLFLLYREFIKGKLKPRKS